MKIPTTSAGISLTTSGSAHTSTLNTWEPNPALQASGFTRKGDNSVTVVPSSIAKNLRQSCGMKRRTDPMLNQKHYKNLFLHMVAENSIQNSESMSKKLASARAVSQVLTAFESPLYMPILTSVANMHRKSKDWRYFFRLDNCQPVRRSAHF